MMSSQCIVPKWSVRQQRQEEGEGEERSRSPHVPSHQNLTYCVPMCNNEVRELSWENGQLGVRWGGGGGGGKPGDHTLESLVHQATSTFNVYAESQQQHSSTSNPIGKWDQKSASTSQMQLEQSGTAAKCSKRVRSESKCGSLAAESASATFCRDTTDATMMTWNSFESPRSLKTARTADDDSVYHDCSQENVDAERLTKVESCRSQSSARRSRAAAIHNLSERRRRDRINEKMKALQKLVPNASKTDKASMLDEVIEYLKQLQAQVNMMSNARNMVMPMPLGMQQQLQMSLLARMGMGMGMGMGVLDVNNLTRNLTPSFPPLMHAAATPLGSATPFLPPPFTMVKPNVDAAAISNDAYNTFLAQQSMNMEFLNKMSALYRQQSSGQQPSKKAVSLSQPNHGGAQGG